MIIRKGSPQRLKNPQERSSKDDFSLLWEAMLYAAFLLSITGCLAETPTKAFIPAPATAEVLPSVTFPYPTIPPTATRTPEPAVAPTSSILSECGVVLFEDDFRIDRGWNFPDEEYGAISLSNDRLVIAIRQPQSFLFTLAPGLSLADYYLEVEVRAEICQPGDEFGVLFRVNETLEHYRFSLDCGGESRMVRILSGESRSITPASSFPFVRSGPMTSNRLCLKAAGDAFQFWINGFEAFSSRDISLVDGAIGLFVRSSQGNQATISFDNFIVRELLPQLTSDLTATP